MSEIKDAQNLNEVVLNDDQIICALTNKIVKATEKELTLQQMIAMMSEEYGFALSDMERDFSFSYEGEEGKKKAKVDLAIFDAGKAHVMENMIRFIIVAKDSKIKANDSKSGAAASLENILQYTDCEFGLWTNGDDLHYMHSVEDEFRQMLCEDISDFPAVGQTLEDLIKAGDKAIPRKPANESLVKTFRRCHDYIYANENSKDTFWQLLNIIFCKMYDEKQRFVDAKAGRSYRRRFWVGVKECSTLEGQHAAAKRIRDLFEELKNDNAFGDVFEMDAKIDLTDPTLAYVASELAKYSFLDATVDVKGTAYETIVEHTLKQSQGQFFTPRNIIRCMVEMLDPDQNTRVLDPACGSGGFLVAVLDHVRKKMTKNMYPEKSDIELEAKSNSQEINDMVREYAENMLFGFDFDNDLKKASRMNMVMSGDGHSNIFNINSLEYPEGIKPDVPHIVTSVNKSIAAKGDTEFLSASNSAYGKFDMVFTNPPFGAKVPVALNISKKFDLGHKWGKVGDRWQITGEGTSSEAPEILFIEACYNFLKPSGKMAIVLPDGILGNPNTEHVRFWILQHFKLLASVDLPVETFLPQVGVQASLLFLQKKTDQEQLIPLSEESYDVFMAIVEKVGKDRRGVPIYKKDDDGADLLYDNVKKWVTVNEYGVEQMHSRKERIKHIDDDLPLVSVSYKHFLEERQ